MGPLKELRARHRRHGAGGEQDEHVRLGRCPQLPQPVQGGYRGSLTDDLVVGGVAAGELALHRFSIVELLVHGQQDRLWHGASQGDQGNQCPSWSRRRVDAFDSQLSIGSGLRSFLENANGLTYRAQRLLAGRDALAPEFTEADIRQPQRPNGVTAPDDDTYKGLLANNFADWRLEVSGLVEKPLSLTREQLQNMPSRTQITRHDCVEGWSCIAKWTGTPLSLVLDQAVVKPQARYVMFHCLDTIEQSLSGDIKYYGTIDLIDARHPQTILAYGLNGKPLPVENGAPLRVRVERQLGYKMPKYIYKIELVDSFANVGGGRGGYWEDNGYDWYGGI